MPPPFETPIGLFLTQSVRTLSRAFDDAMAAEGGSAATWVILIALKTHTLGTQRELAATVGIQQATLTHHLNAMETAGLVTRRRDPSNHRVQLVDLTEAGDAMFLRLRGVAMAYDQRLREGIPPDEIALVRDVLHHMLNNVAAEVTGSEAHA